jgi:hypothetical protein
MASPDTNEAPPRHSVGRRTYEKKEVSVYYRVVGARLVVLTVKARYGRESTAG